MTALPDVLLAPFPYFGGKSAVAPAIWDALGDVPNYVEPFAGSLAVLLQRPSTPQLETVNDLDGFITNAWRAIQADPDGVTFAADWPVNECDLHARHTCLLSRRDELTDCLVSDPDYYDAKIAAWWIWGACCWIGSGWCRGDGPWMLQDGVLRKRPHLGNAGQGIHRKRPHLGNAGQGIHEYLQALSDRLRRVRICCGDWSRVMGPTPTVKNGLTGVFLDPPYRTETRTDGLYSIDMEVFDAVKDWAIKHGSSADYRIVLCGYDGETMPDDWRLHTWKARGGFGSQGQGMGRKNSARECLWFSPYCLVKQRSLFDCEAVS